ncbi:MAG: hypothetical protein VX259_10235, partial [Pseudomonadota bacterium]|nr:hypothetical protein [Pseudomonadota bacterium]
DRFEPVQTALLAMADVAEGQLAELAVRAAGGEDIRQVRIAFKPVSEALIAEGVPEGYGIAYCPMAFNHKGANWAQRTEGEIMNPYYGDNMLHCGYLEDEDEADTTITN